MLPWRPEPDSDERNGNFETDRLGRSVETTTIAPSRIDVRPLHEQHDRMTTRSAYLRQLRDRVTLTDLVRDTVGLTEISGFLRGRCPAHPDAVLSLHVHQSMHLFRCYGCGLQGDVVRWAMVVNDMDEAGAMEFLASRAGLPPPPLS